MKKFIKKNDFIKLLKDEMTISVGGFLTNGTPEKLIDLVIESKVKGLTVICNDGGFEDKGVGRLIVNNQVKKLIASHIGTNPYVGKLMQESKIEVELVPQGTLAERIRAFGAGLGGILTPTGLQTIVENGKQILEVKGQKYLLEEALGADLALIGGAVADDYGNLKYSQTMRNFNPVMATAAEIVVVETVKRVSEIDPEDVITPFPFVDYILED
ncbi:MAG: 3-oxoacid CoA-transferase subunit A [Candidatus Izemoplasmatales bacterium]|jgi:acetate CoA/acetoacetate CoA-transferase alpha subunit|nr:3-oxoacid CoA-transferase subunit A [Candidatus Izemoplasmatales bacterium]